MWILTNSNDEFFILMHEKVKYTVGRAGADLVLSNDTSISRAHAVLHLIVTEQRVESLELEDTGSKYGTFHNDGIAKNQRIGKGERSSLKHGDRIRFGLLNNFWNVAHQPLTTLASSLSKNEAQQLEQYMLILGGTILQSWEAGCTHLTMSEVTITVKLLYALLEQLPIVTCEYWRDVLKAARRGRAFLPPVEKYMPRRCDALMQKKDIDLKSRPERRHLFTGMTFVFMNRKHYDMYAMIIQKAGGSCKDLNCGIKKTFLTKTNVVVVQYVPSTQSQSSQTIGEIEEFLQTNSRRTIPEYEIGLAIIHCSTEKFCNANCNVINDIMLISQNSETAAKSDLGENSHATSAVLYSEATEVFIPETAATTPSTMSNKITPESLAGDERMSNMHVSESVDTSQNKRKRSMGDVAYENDDKCDEEESQNAKRPYLARNSKRKVTPRELSCSPSEKPSTSKTKTTPKSSAKPLPIEINSKKKTITTASFFEKGARKATATSAVVDGISSSTGGKSPERLARKRTIIGVISDDDDDLFSFGETANKSTHQAHKRARVTHHNASANDSDDGLFGFTDMPMEHVDKTKNNKMAAQHNRADTDDDAEESDPAQFPKSKEKNKTVLAPIPKPKPQPKKISVENWLSCSLNDMNINEQAYMKLDKIKDELKDDTDNGVQQWLNTLKGGFEVRKRTVNLTSTRGETTAKSYSENGYASKSREDVNSSCLNSSRKNFKAFVKKNNAFPQQRVLTTKPTFVSHLRLR